MNSSARLRVPFALALGVLVLLSAPAVAHEEKDPVCGMMVEIEKAHGKEVYAGTTYYF